MTMMDRIEKMRVSDDALDLVFRKARTYNAWLPKPVPEELLRQLYDTLKWGPTSANISPARFLFIRSTAAKERLRPSLAPGNWIRQVRHPRRGIFVGHGRRARARGVHTAARRTHTRSPVRLRAAPARRTRPGR